MSKKKARRYYKDEEALKKMGERIRKARLLKGISIEQLAYDCEVDSSQIGRMELGKVDYRMSSFLRTAKALDTDPRELLP